MVTKKPTPKKWIQGMDLKEGTLKTMLGVDKNKNIGPTLLNKIANAEVGKTVSTPGGKKKVTPLMKKKVNAARNMNK
jgi:hypothetical protein